MSASRSDEATKQQPQRSTTTSGVRIPPVITYVPIPGSWQREENPHWPESAFQVPAEVPYGTIYYVTKGTWIGQGSTTHIELLPSGHVVKSPVSNPYFRKNEEESRERLRTEARVYERLKKTPYAPELINWDPDSCCLTLEYLEMGSLDAYVRQHVEMTTEGSVVYQISPQVRQRWALQAARAVATLHASDIIHCDVTPRNFLLNTQLDLHIADFGGCSISGSAPLIAPGPRYQPPGWSWNRDAMEEDDVFALGSVLYFIMAGAEPCADLEEEEMEYLFQAARFPDVEQLARGGIIQGCWAGTFSSAEQVVRALQEKEERP